MLAYSCPSPTTSTTLFLQLYKSSGCRPPSCPARHSTRRRLRRQLRSQRESPGTADRQWGSQLTRRQEQYWRRLGRRTPQCNSEFVASIRPPPPLHTIREAKLSLRRHVSISAT